jgi:hypothetical protein
MDNVQKHNNCNCTKLVLALASTVIVGSQSGGTYDHILLSDGSELTNNRLVLLITSGHGPRRKHRLPLLLYPIVAAKTCFFAESLLS